MISMRPCRLPGEWDVKRLCTSFVLAALMVQYKPRVIVMDLNRVPDIEYSALQMIEEGERCRTEQGVTVWLAGLNPGVLEVIRHAGMDVRLGRERLLFSAQVAIERYLKLSPELAVTPAVTSKS